MHENDLKVNHKYHNDTSLVQLHMFTDSCYDGGAHEVGVLVTVLLL